MTRSQEMIGGVSLIRIIGDGAFGEVWLGIDGVGTPAAVKVVDRHRRSDTATMREEHALSLLRDRIGEHPSLVRLTHIGVDSGRFFYCMELADPLDASAPAPADGYTPLTLQTLLTAGVPLDLDEAARIVQELLDGLQHLHAHGIIHRDMKPANVLRVDGRWKLADFGLATAEATELTTVGTLGYLAPNGPLDRSADLYAVGKILYCMITGNGTSAYPSIARAFTNAIDRERFGAMVRVVNRACHERPEMRYRSASEMSGDLARATDARRVRARRMRRAATAALAACSATIAATYYLTREPPIGIGSEIVATASGDRAPMRLRVIKDEVWPIREGGNGHRYLALAVEADVQWGLVDAVREAESLGGYVASITSQEEHDWIFQHVASDDRLWRRSRLGIPGWVNPAILEAGPAVPKLEPRRANEHPDPIDLPDDVWTNSFGPLIGAKYSGDSFQWLSGEPWQYDAWDILQPYGTPSELETKAVVFGTTSSEAISSTWVAVSAENPALPRPNYYTSFIVEIE